MASNYEKSSGRYDVTYTFLFPLSLLWYVSLINAIIFQSEIVKSGFLTVTIYCFTTYSEIFCSFWDVILAGERLRIQKIASILGIWIAVLLTAENVVFLSFRQIKPKSPKAQSRLRIQKRFMTGKYADHLLSEGKKHVFCKCLN